MCLSLSSRFSLRSSLLSPGGRPFSTPSRPSGTAPSRHSGIESLHPSISLLILVVLVSSLFSRLSSLFSLLLMLLLLAAAHPAAAAFFAFCQMHWPRQRSPHIWAELALVTWNFASGHRTRPQHTLSVELLLLRTRTFGPLYSLLSALLSPSSIPSSLAAAHFSDRTADMSLRSMHQAIDFAPNCFDPWRLPPWPGGMREAIKL